MELQDKKNRIKKLRKKAELSRNAHFMIANRLKLYSNCLHSFVLIGSTVTAILTFANYDAFLPIFKNLNDKVYKLTIGLIASLVFIVTVIEEFLKLEKRASEHEGAGKQLTTFIRNADLIEKSTSINEGDILQLTQSYTTICENSPVIPDKVFFKAKKHLYEKIAISKELEINPFMNIYFFKLMMRLKQFKSITANEGAEGEIDKKERG
ncbi:hypothetical protein BO219_04405 [Anoxybacillus kestanbolensis]|uniref:SMODS and SLOG-associating 2TM effector domain-containing protein n=1 Tax=Anoxybacillus kestanbolensis TaxID=227476 RepID=A0A1V3FSE1_9BACL|nr:SLATT domain-containing protein [Anoxybacillus kestanbolensis]OOE04642.1 hypothetical protein BO219_04405 [Anoxybacillus kestanbolensis]